MDKERSRSRNYSFGAFLAGPDFVSRVNFHFVIRAFLHFVDLVHRSLALGGQLAADESRGERKDEIFILFIISISFYVEKIKNESVSM